MHQPNRSVLTAVAFAIGFATALMVNPLLRDAEIAQSLAVVGPSFASADDDSAPADEDNGDSNAKGQQMAKSEQGFVTSIGGIFFKSKDKKGLMAWYKSALGIDAGQYGHLFKWREMDDPSTVASTTWGLFPDDTGYFDPSDKPFMINYRVRDLDGLLAHLESQGIERVGEVEEYEYGRFAWIMDPEGTKIELWEPAGEFE